MRPGLGPTLPALLSARYGIPQRRTTLAAVAVVVVILVAVLAVRHALQDPQLVHHGTPTFNLVYGAPIHRGTPRPGELARLVAHTQRASWSLSAHALPLPAYRGDLGHALLPVLAERDVDQLRATYPGFGVRDEGRAQVNGLPGYQIGFVAEGGRLHGRDIMVLPADSGARMGVLLSLRQNDPSRVVRVRETTVASAFKEAIRSFAFGAARS